MTIFKSVISQQTRQKMKTSYRLTTHKLCLIAVFLALVTVVSLLEIPTFFLTFLNFDFANTVNLLAVYVIGWPYAFLIGIISPWLRLFLPTTTGGTGGVIGALSSMLSTMTILITLFSLLGIVNRFLKPNYPQWIKLLFIIVATILAGVITSVLNVFYNYTFLLDLYHAATYKSLVWTVFLPFNLFKFTFVLSFFLILKKPFIVVKNSFHL